MNKLSGQEKVRMQRLIATVQESLMLYEMQQESAKKSAGQKNNFDAVAKKLWDFRVETKNKFPDQYPDIVRNSEKRDWELYQPFRDATSNDGIQVNDMAAGWRNSFDEPSTQGWKPREAFKKITNNEASFDRYSIEAKPAKEAIAMFRPRVPVTPEAKYTLSYDVKSPAAAKFRCRVVCGRKTLANINATADNKHWQQGKGIFTVPADAKQITLYICIYNAPAGGFIDNIELTRQ